MIILRKSFLDKSKTRGEGVVCKEIRHSQHRDHKTFSICARLF
jgi:hypothetical protein